VVRPVLLPAAPERDARRRGIFFDYHDTGDFERDFGFTRAVSEATSASTRVARRHLFETWTPEQRRAHLVKRGARRVQPALRPRHLFGLKTGATRRHPDVAARVSWP
jgi:coproporphyrinogen III oxidase